MNLHLMDTNLMVLSVVTILLVTAIVWLYAGKRETTTANLRKKFGSKHDQAMRILGAKRKAEEKLEEREKRVEKFNIHELGPMERGRFVKQWESVQAHIVESPKEAVKEADDLVNSLMKTRGYPVSDSDQSADDVSVDHPHVIENYRAAHEIALRAGKDEATTEELRMAMIYYRSLFEDLAHAPASVEIKEVA
jgi:hypothetical protein